MLPALRPGLSTQEQEISLAGVYQRYFPIGAAVDPEDLHSLGGPLARQFNSLTAENHMKWERLNPRPGNDPAAYDFSRADEIVRFASERGMRVRGHTLVWHRQVPEWVFRGPDGSPASRAQVLERLREHIETVLAHFRGKVYCWDVVNEAGPNGDYRWGDGSSLPELPEELAELQPRGYGELFRVLREQAGPGGLAGVSFWGLSDDHTWLDDFPVRGRKDWPLLFDPEHRPKKAFWAVSRC
jgi:GH35 family endo-1,4-beta-xylanase